MLRELIEGAVPKGEDRQAVGAIDLVVANCVGPENRTIEAAATDDDFVVVAELVTLAYIPLLHTNSMAGGCDSLGRSRRLLRLDKDYQADETLALVARLFVAGRRYTRYPGAAHRAEVRGSTDVVA